MFHVLENETADELWSAAAKWFLPGGVATAQPSRSGDTSEVLHAALSLRDPRQRWIASRSPALNPAFAIAEVIWILRGREDSAFLNYFNRDLPKYSGCGPKYHGAYGFRLRKHFGIDQLERAFFALKANPSSRQVVLQFWDSAKDFPDHEGLSSAEDIPCNVAAFLKVRSGKLEWTQIMRSNDLFRGLPHNIIQFTTLQEVVAGWLGLELCDYHHFSDSLHLYSTDGDVQERVASIKVPVNIDSLALPKESSDAAFAALSSYVDTLITPSTSADAITHGLGRLELTMPFLNLAAILAAEALRRRGESNLMLTTLDTCTNQCLKLMFSRYAERMSKTTIR